MGFGRVGVPGLVREATEPWKALRAAVFTARLKSGPDTNLIPVVPGSPCHGRNGVMDSEVGRSGRDQGGDDGWEGSSYPDGLEGAVRLPRQSEGAGGQDKERENDGVEGPVQIWQWLARGDEAKEAQQLRQDGAETAPKEEVKLFHGGELSVRRGDQEP